MQDMSFGDGGLRTSRVIDPGGAERNILDSRSSGWSRTRWDL